ncbi:unnamed protein product [Ostreobium quekettii]|uniref:Peroxisomal membrane protein PEX16 n=1 Tax=Ostreobium quekettii TaxID=121088 RepID=A0A8S1IQY4_9CHLO|nr:unnamed protein product [Ostreobium quekettii]
MPSWAEAYREWARAHPGVLQSAGETLDQLTWLLPQRFSGSEVLSESLSAALGLAGLWHGWFVSDWEAPGQSAPWPMLLAIVRRVEVLVEMRASYLEDLGKWSKYGPLMVVELTKSLLRLFMFQSMASHLAIDSDTPTIRMQAPTGPGTPYSASCGDRPPALITAFARLRNRDRVLSPEMVQLMPQGLNDDPPSAQCSQGTDGTDPDTAMHQEIALPDNGEPSGASGVASPRSDGFEVIWNEHVKSHGEPLWWQKPGLALSSEEGPLAAMAMPGASSQHALGQRVLLVGELLQIVRPLLYVMALRRNGCHSWAPWLLSLGLELTSHHLVARGGDLMRESGLSPHDGPGSLQESTFLYMLRLANFEWGPAEARELRRRKMLLLLYLLRSPFFDLVTGRVVRGTGRVFGRLPLVGCLAGKAVELLLGAQQYYSYTSGS